AEAKEYALDLSWVDTGDPDISPYPNDMFYGIGMIWGIAFVVDFIYSWSYTLFPSKKKRRPCWLDIYKSSRWWMSPLSAASLWTHILIDCSRLSCAMCYHHCLHHIPCSHRRWCCHPG